MPIEFTRLTRLGHAEALSRCVYETYGLTFHRSYLYEPDRTLALNAQGHLVSFVAMDGNRCVGHLALIRPFYEYTEEGRPVAGDRIREIGLAMILPSVRGEGVLASLVLEAYAFVRENGILGTYSRCVTHQTTSQRHIQQMGGMPTGVMLGGVPSWVRYETDDAPGEGSPITTLLCYNHVVSPEVSDVVLPSIDRDIYEAIYARLGEPRNFLDPAPPPRLGPPTELQVHFDPHRQQGRIHVLCAGPDVEDQVIQRFRWLLGGRIRHVTVIAPLGSPHVAAAIPAWKAHGFVFGGLIPSMHRGDVAIYQGLRDIEIDPDEIRVLDPLATRIVERAVDDWWRARDLPVAAAEIPPFARLGMVL